MGNVMFEELTKESFDVLHGTMKLYCSVYTDAFDNVVKVHHNDVTYYLM